MTKIQPITSSLAERMKQYAKFEHGIIGKIKNQAEVLSEDLTKAYVESIGRNSKSVQLPVISNEAKLSIEQLNKEALDKAYKEGPQVPFN